MNLSKELQNKKIERAMKDLNLELKKDAIDFNKKIEIAVLLQIFILKLHQHL